MFKRRRMPPENDSTRSPARSDSSTSASTSSTRSFSRRPRSRYSRPKNCRFSRAQVRDTARGPAGRNRSVHAPGHREQSTSCAADHDAVRRSGATARRPSGSSSSCPRRSGPAARTSRPARSRSSPRRRRRDHRTGTCKPSHRNAEETAPGAADARASRLTETIPTSSPPTRRVARDQRPSVDHRPAGGTDQVDLTP